MFFRMPGPGDFSGVAESTMYGAPALKVQGKLLACIPSHRSAEPGSLVVCVDFADRAALLAEAPDAYYVTDHYIGYASVLFACLASPPLRCATCSAWPTSL